MSKNKSIPVISKKDLPAPSRKHRYYTPDEVKVHNSANDCYVSIFYEVYDFARAVMPSKSRAYEEIDFLASKSLITIKELASSIVIKIQGAGDSALLESSGVITELSNQLSKLGFVPGNSRKTDYSALVEVRSVITKTAETYQTYPEISIRLMEKGNEKVTYIKNLPKVAGFDKETVIRRTAIALTEDIKKSFIKECF